MEMSFCGPQEAIFQFIMKNFVKMDIGLGKVIAVYFGGKDL